MKASVTSARDTVDLFLAAAKTQRLRPAVRTGSQFVSYAQLEERARRVAHAVAQRQGPRVLIALPQSADAYAAMLGVAMGGGYYAPVNPASAPEKIRRIVRSFEPHFVIAAADGGEALLADAPAADLLTPQQINQSPRLDGRGLRHELAYVIFTSGSTGEPKGVVISRAALDHYVDWLVDHIGVAPTDIVSQHPSIAFDLSVMDIFAALCCGAALCPLASPGDRLMPARVIARERITVWISVPSVISLMVQARQADAEHLATLRLLAICGEPQLPEHLQAIFSACPDARVLNTYGPTETTVSVTSLALSAETYPQYGSRTVAIGPAIPGMDIRLLGGANPDEGEIVIRGPQLANGYWRDREQTDRAFRTIVVDGRPMRAYFTGDWAERVNGQVYFRRRIDSQVKVKGLRLELDEIAAAIRSLGFAEACVTMRRDEIVAVIEGASSDLDEAALRRALAMKLETHALPARCIGVASLPRNENDKIDRLAVEQLLDGLAGDQAADQGGSRT